MAEQLLAMPEPLRLSLASAHTKALFTDITGQDAHILAGGCGTWPAVRLPLLMLAPIAVAYESEMHGIDANRRATWREDRYSPCSRQEAGKYLTFLASVGYQLAPIEQAVADDVPYTGDTPDESLPEPATEPAAEDSVDGGTGPGVGDAAGEAGAGPAEPGIPATEDNESCTVS